MDKKAIIGIILIVLITLLMPVYQKWIGGDPVIQKPQGEISTTDSTLRNTPPANQTEIQKQAQIQKTPEPEVLKDEAAVTIAADSVFSEKTLSIETDVISSQWSTAKGGNLTKWELKNYKHFQGGLVNLIEENYLDIYFLDKNGKEVHLSNFVVEGNFSNQKQIVLNEQNPETEIVFSLPIAGGKISKIIKLGYQNYDFELTVKFENLADYVINRRFFVTWKKGLLPTEENLSDDNSYTKAFIFMADELEDVDADDKFVENTYSGRVDWLAARTKYFLQAIAPLNKQEINGAIIGSEKHNGEEELEIKEYDITLENNFPAQNLYAQNFMVILSPLDHYKLKEYERGFEKLVMNRDWYERLFRPISLLIIPAFKFLYRFIPNYGFVIIIFSILVKLLLYPLTKKSYQSMSEMQYLQPKMTELREKYKNDQQRLNREMMKLYKEHGVNPMGGCLPMLLQMPLLFSLFIVFRSTIQLRGEPFILWITDLSRADSLSLGFSLPFIGDSIHVLPILMGITMIWQSKISMTDPKQKAMIYFMPLFMIFIFYSLPSGLNLYYTLFNLLSMWQTASIKKRMHPDNNKKMEPATQPAVTPKRKQKK